MNSKNTSMKNDNIYKLDYLCYNKIKSIPKKNLVSKKSLNNIDISHYNNSIEIDTKVQSKFRKINRHSQQKPILSERIKRNYSNGVKKGLNYGELNNEQNSIYKINNTELNSLNNLLGLNDISLSPGSMRKNGNAKNIFDKNIIINNNNYDKKIIFLGDKNYNFNYNDDKNIKIIHSHQEIFPYENDNDKIYLNSKTSIENSENKNQYYEHSKKRSSNNLSLNMLDPSYNNNTNFKSLKNLNNSQNRILMKEKETLKGELNTFLKENMNLKFKMSNLLKNGQNNDINKINKNNTIFLKNKKRKNLSFKKNVSYSKADEEYENSKYSKTSNLIGKQSKNDKGEKKNSYNSIYDSMKFKIQKRKFSNSNNNKNKKGENLNNYNSINIS